VTAIVSIVDSFIFARQVSTPITKIPIPPRHDSGESAAVAACTPEEIYCYTQYNSLSAIPRPFYADAMGVQQIQVSPSLNSTTNITQSQSIANTNNNKERLIMPMSTFHFISLVVQVSFGVAFFLSHFFSHEFKR